MYATRIPGPAMTSPSRRLRPRGRVSYSRSPGIHARPERASVAHDASDGKPPASIRGWAAGAPRCSVIANPPCASGRPPQPGLPADDPCIATRRMPAGPHLTAPAAPPILATALVRVPHFLPREPTSMTSTTPLLAVSTSWPARRQSLDEILDAIQVDRKSVV